tara:strand:- start:764 stop:1312 length:549 start_codon:yes stop_codon:yes gene_type:complete
MGFFGNIFGNKETLSTENVRKKIANYYVKNLSIIFGEHYEDILNGVDNKKKMIAELFVFRFWTAQFGFRIFSSQPVISEKIIEIIYNEGKLQMESIHKDEEVDIESELNKKYDDLIDSRWQEYDKVITENDSDSLPTMKLCGKLLDFSGGSDAGKLYLMSTDFLSHLNQIKQEAIKIGLLKS